MFTASTSPAQAYSNVGVETGVMAANPHKLILMLFDGALLAIATATHALEESNIPAKGAAVSKAIDIVGSGLKASLDFNAGGDLAARLAALYDYVCERLLHANSNNDKAALAECAHLLSELRNAWQEIAGDPAVVSLSGKAG